VSAILLLPFVGDSNTNLGNALRCKSFTSCSIKILPAALELKHADGKTAGHDLPYVCSFDSRSAENARYQKEEHNQKLVSCAYFVNRLTAVGLSAHM
jgi:hypothetical protein